MAVRILVLADSIKLLKQWVKRELVGHDVVFSEPRLNVVVDGVEFILRPYDMVDTVGGYRFNTVLHVGDTPMLARQYIRVPPP